jgi:SPP1 family predicted phage head-tail adaptor
MSLGKMRNWTEVYNPVRISDGALGNKREDRHVISLWSRIEPVSGREIFRYQHLEQELTHKVTIRYRQDIRQGMFLRWDNRDFYILTVIDKNERKEFLELICREGGQK